MALIVRYWTPNAGQTVAHHSGRTYAANASGILDVPASDAEAVHPAGAIRLGYVGTTADRPVNDGTRLNWPPREVYDSTLAKTVYLIPGSSPAKWVDISGTSS
jgi:hypothetical protein